MTYTKNCPNCHRTYASGTGDGTEYGSPLKVCSVCGAEFIDNATLELAISGFPKRYNKRFEIRDIFGIVLGLYLILFSIVLFYYNGETMVLSLIIGVFFTVSSIRTIISDIKGFPTRMGNWYNEYYLSGQRLKDMNYILRLYNGGYKLPDKYLQFKHTCPHCHKRVILYFDSMYDPDTNSASKQFFGKCTSCSRRFKYEELS